MSVPLFSDRVQRMNVVAAGEQRHGIAVAEEVLGPRRASQNAIQMEFVDEMLAISIVELRDLLNGCRYMHYVHGTLLENAHFEGQCVGIAGAWSRRTEDLNGSIYNNINLGGSDTAVKNRALTCAVKRVLELMCTYLLPRKMVVNGQLHRLSFISATVGYCGNMENFDRFRYEWPKPEASILAVCGFGNALVLPLDIHSSQDSLPEGPYLRTLRDLLRQYHYYDVRWLLTAGSILPVVIVILMLKTKRCASNCRLWYTEAVNGSLNQALVTSLLLE